MLVFPMFYHAVMDRKAIYENSILRQDLKKVS